MSDPTEHVSLGRLIDRERIRGASRMIPEGTDAKDVTAEQINTCAADVISFCHSFKPQISFAAIAKSTGYSPGVISEFLKGKYQGNNGQVALDLESWLVEEEQRRARPQTTQFVWTNVALRIKSAANIALDRKKISLIFGPDASGIGKTMALTAIGQELGPRRATVCTVDKVDANPSGLLRKLCTSMHLNDGGSNRQRYERLVKALHGRSHLLMVDQIHNLRGAKEDKPFYILTDLYDATQTAQLWCGTADIVGYLNRQQQRSADESLAQIRSRIFPAIDLMESLRDEGGPGEPIATIDQIREIFAKNKLKLTGAGARFLMIIANTPESGSLRFCAQLIDYITTMGSKLTTIDVPVIKEAMRLGLTTARADVMLRRIESTVTRMAKVG